MQGINRRQAERPITRVSVELDDSAYRPMGWLLPDGRSPQIYLNGVRQELVLTADSELGFVRLMRRGPNGLVKAPNGDQFETVDLRGDVVIEIA